MKSDGITGTANNPLMSVAGKLAGTSVSDPLKVNNNGDKSVKAEPSFDHMAASSFYSSHFGTKGAMGAPYPLTGATGAHDPSAGMLTSLPHLTPAPFSSHAAHAHAVAAAGYPSLDDMKAYNNVSPHSHLAPHPGAATHQPDYSSLHSMGATAATSSGVFSYPGLSAGSAVSFPPTGVNSPEHSHHSHNSAHHHAKLQTS